MTYLDLVIEFWQKDIEFNFSDKEVALYFYLLKVCNNTRWKNPFGLSNAITIARFGWGKTSFDTAKNNLKKAGLIDFKAGDGRGNVYQYSICGTKKVNEKVSQNNTLSDTLSPHLSDTLSDPKPATSIDIDKEVETKESGGASPPVPKTLEEKKEELDKRARKFAETLAPYVEEYTRPTVKDFYEYWTEPNKSYTKMRFELQKTWQISGRLRTWRNREPQFQKKVTPADEVKTNSQIDEVKKLINQKNGKRE